MSPTELSRSTSRTTSPMESGNCWRPASTEMSSTTGKSTATPSGLAAFQAAAAAGFTRALAGGADVEIEAGKILDSGNTSQSVLMSDFVAAIGHSD